MGTESPCQRFAFSKRALQSVSGCTRQQTFHDAKTPHLTIRVGKRQRVFYWYGRTDRGPRWIKMGAFPELSVENARKKAMAISANVAMGKPPLEAASGDDTTLGAAFETYLDVHAKPHKRSWLQGQYLFDRHLSDWTHRPLSQISKAELQRFHAEIGPKTGKTTANRVGALLSSMWNVAKDHEYWDGENPVRGVRKFRERERGRYLKADELPTFFAELEADSNQDYADYVRLSLFTGARQSNVLAMRWGHVSLDRAEWRIPGEPFKSGEDQCIPLSPKALDVLTRRHSGVTSSFVFPGRGVTGHLTRPGKWWTRFLQRCGFSENLTMHDLRRTVGSWPAADGAGLLVIGQTLGHQDRRSTQVYSRLDLRPVRDSLTATAAAIKEAAKGNQS